MLALEVWSVALLFSARYRRHAHRLLLSRTTVTANLEHGIVFAIAYDALAFLFRFVSVS